jgi:hypothetical protein
LNAQSDDLSIKYAQETSRIAVSKQAQKAKRRAAGMTSRGAPTFKLAVKRELPVASKQSRTWIMSADASTMIKTRCLDGRVLSRG